MKRRVVITGMGAVTPIGNTIEEFWDGIRSGKSGIAPITHFDASEYKVKLAEYNTLKQELKNTYGEDQEKERRLDLLRYQYNEIEQANLKENEEEELEEKHKMMQNAEK